MRPFMRLAFWWHLLALPAAAVDVAVGSDGEVRGLVRQSRRHQDVQRAGSLLSEDPEGFSGLKEYPLTSTTWPDGTWNRADEYCREKGKKLCDYKKVCPDGRSKDPAIPGGQKKYEMWTPVRNAEDANNPVEWVQVGTRYEGDLCCLVSSDCHGRIKNFQGWGEVKSFNGFVYCCDDELHEKHKIKEHRLTQKDWNGSWPQAARFCEQQGMRLPEWGEICPKGRGNMSVVPQLGRDMWAPVKNSGATNKTIQWAQVGLRMDGDICKLITDFPGHAENFQGWGEVRPYTEYVYCRTKEALLKDEEKSGVPARGPWLALIALLLGGARMA